MAWPRLALCTILFLNFCQHPTVIAALFENVEHLPQTDYDFVIVGGGIAGCVVANRLSEDDHINVLLLEAGGTNVDQLLIDIPFLVYTIPSKYEWNSTTIPQPALNNRSVNFPHAFVLGGSSSHNGMVYNRGPKDDWDRFARLTGDSGWSWANIQQFIAKNERWTPPVDGHNTSGQYDPAVHSTTGITSVTLEGYPFSSDPFAIQASQELGDIFAFNLDYNSGSPLGLSWGQYTINNGSRSSSAASYLAPNFTQRPNLHVLVNARVSRVLNTEADPACSHTPTFRAVQFAHNLDGPLHRINASKEVILSASAINTPQILLNSGIGNSTFLSSIGIPPLVNLPSVGQNLSVHPFMKNVWMVNSSFETPDVIFQNQTVKDDLIEEWKRYKRGPLVNSPSAQTIYFRFNESVLEELGEDPSSGETAPHAYLGIQPGFIPVPPSSGKFISLSTAIATPTSRGSITINSTHPDVFAPPVIDAGTLTTEWDLFAMRQAIRTAFLFFSAPVWQEYIIGPVPALAAAMESDEALDDYIRSVGGPNEHVVGTASMTARNADYGVVDPDLVVKGVTGLRIVDASILPLVTAGHTQAPVYILAERASALIKDKGAAPSELPDERMLRDESGQFWFMFLFLLEV